MPVSLAVRMSGSIPIIFNPIRYNNNWYIDGAVINNFPIKYCNPKTTLGLYINHQTNNDFNHIIDFIKGIVTIISHQSCHKDIQNNNLNIIKINAYTTTFDLGINKESREQIILNGETQVKEYINNLPQIICSQIINDIITQL
jgi:predicted acylesterase/phospholipase RssA